jgi:GH15 family glucan-1,4-alpha-glucosidase
VPRFDSPSVFAAILDDGKGGHFKIAPVSKDVTCKQIYWPETNVLITRFLELDGAAELTDFMPVGRAVSGGKHRLQLIRRVTTVRGTLRFRMECRPAFNYARDVHTATITADGAMLASTSLSLGLATRQSLEKVGGAVVSEFTLSEGETAVFVLRDLSPQSGCGISTSAEEAEDLFRRTVEFWQRWIGQSRYTGRWREMVHRSALALKLLTYQPTGAIVAAPTCSLPESIGGERNWDYRCAWIRDAAFTVYAFLRIGLSEEAEQFMHFLASLCKEPGPSGSLQIMYGIDGRKHLLEERLDHLDGYMGSKPVRIGNGAYNQLQLDIYGELLDAAYLYNKHGAPISYDLWTSLRALTDWVCDNWRRKDEGVWEVRSGRQEFVYSKLMCWVALDRAIRLADKRSFPAPRDRWLRVRDEIYEDIVSKGWKREAGAGKRLDQPKRADVKSVFPSG